MQAPKRPPPLLGAALAALAAPSGGMMFGGTPVVRLEPSLKEPPTLRHYPPKVEAKLAYHRTGHKANREERARLRALNAEEQSRINKMSNWQRNQWARAGYPKKRIDEFVAMERRNA